MNLSEEDRPVELTDYERRLVSLAVAWDARREDSVLYTDEAVIDALALDAHERATLQARVSGRSDAAWIDQVTERIEEQLRERRFGVRRVREAPAAYMELQPASVALLLEGAASRRVAPLLDLAVAAGSGRELWDAECEQFVPLPPGVPGGSYVALKVAGDSMTPLMHSGDIVLVRLRTVPVRGSVVVAKVADGGYVVKQVGRIAEKLIELRSLNVAYPPVSIRRTRNAVVGTVVLCWCSHGPPAEPGR